MAGHSKWKNIQHRKGRQDAIRGKVFAKLAREIYVAARQGDPNPDHNQKLRLAISKAKTQNMPNDNIERAINKASGAGDGKEYEEVRYEGYGPLGTAIMVEALTDNRNRTAADMRYVFSKKGGNLGETGCVSWMFDRKGCLTIEEDKEREEELMLFALENGAEDFEAADNHYVIITRPEDTETMQVALVDAGFVVADYEVGYVSSTKVAVSEEEQEKVLQLIEEIENYEDVQQVYTNMEG